MVHACGVCVYMCVYVMCAVYVCTEKKQTEPGFIQQDETEVICLLKSSSYPKEPSSKLFIRIIKEEAGEEVLNWWAETPLGPHIR